VRYWEQHSVGFNGRIQGFFQRSRKSARLIKSIMICSRKSRNRPLWQSGILIMIVVAFGTAFNKARTYSRPSAYQPFQADNSVSDRPLFKSVLISSGITRVVHAPSVVELADGNLRAFWFAGDREGGSDVEIHSTVFDRKADRWSNETVAQTRFSVQADLYRHIRKLGNPVAARDTAGKLWLFFVSTSIGGWSTSAVNMTTSVDDGNTWSPVRRLITSPFFNLSTLVKTVPFFYRDGTLGLPIYHELFAKYGEILHLDSAGTVVEKQRLNDKWRTLQPLVLIGSSGRAVALMRYSDNLPPHTAIQVMTDDSGRHWSETVRSTLPNPDSAMAGTAIGKDRMIVVINNDPRQRDDLTLMVSEDNSQAWTEVFRFEDKRQFRRHVSRAEYTDEIRRSIETTDPDFSINHRRVTAVGNVMCGQDTCRYRFDYPYLIRTYDGVFHLLYTWNGTYIKHIEFNLAWLEKQLKDPNS
jgi:predicted neuraminidase